MKTETRRETVLVQCIQFSLGVFLRGIEQGLCILYERLSLCVCAYVRV